MSTTFSIALSALRADSDAIDITGNNLANLNTTGFKGSNVHFESLLSESLSAGSGGGFGLGVSTPISEQVFGQGAIQTSSLPLATAIEGNGFFVLRNAVNQQQFTRDGSFKLSSDGTLETQTGEKVQGWTASGGVLNATGAPSDLVFPTGTALPPIATSNITTQLNLDASATADASSKFSAPIQVIDSLGNTHTLSLTFTKTAANTWSYDVSIPSADLTGNQSGDLATGSISFNSDGTLSSANTSPVPLTVSGLADGATKMSINWNLFNPNGTTPTITQYAQSSGLASSEQDGSAAAQLQQISIQNGGQIMATYSNGKQLLQGQLALASILNPDSLSNVGNNNFVLGADSAAPAIGMPQSGGRGQIIGSALEGSNVDMGSELANLIAFQSNYGANSKVIATANTMAQDLLTLVQ
jgi:flagellar hook protein FlgE